MKTPVRAASRQLSATTNSFSLLLQPDRPVWLRVDAMAKSSWLDRLAPEAPVRGFWRSQELRAGGTQAVEGSTARRAAATTTSPVASRLPRSNPYPPPRAPLICRLGPVYARTTRPVIGGRWGASCEQPAGQRRREEHSNPGPPWRRLPHASDASTGSAARLIKPDKAIRNTL